VTILKLPLKLFLVIVKDLLLYKEIWSYGYHGVAPVSKPVSGHDAARAQSSDESRDLGRKLGHYFGD
jgi:hypothetical protein